MFARFIIVALFICMTAALPIRGSRSLFHFTNDSSIPMKVTFQTSKVGHRWTTTALHAKLVNTVFPKGKEEKTVINNDNKNTVSAVRDSNQYSYIADCKRWLPAVLTISIVPALVGKALNVDSEVIAKIMIMMLLSFYVSEWFTMLRAYRENTRMMDLYQERIYYEESHKDVFKRKFITGLCYILGVCIGSLLSSSKKETNSHYVFDNRLCDNHSQPSSTPSPYVNYLKG